MTPALSVNLNKIALIRNSREGDYPNVESHGLICLEQGACGITVHPRPDQRHIRPVDVINLAQLTKNFSSTSGSKKEFNIEGNPFAPANNSNSGLSKQGLSYPGLYPLAEQTKPDQVTFVPDSNNQLTSDHGFDLYTSGDQLKHIIEQYHDLNIRVSLFMDPDINQIKLAKDIGADRIELYTGPYALAHRQSAPNLSVIIEKYKQAALTAHEIGLGVNAGHDLNLCNLPGFLSIQNINEVSIGHALTVDALSLGLVETVRRYTKICQDHHY